MQTVKRVGLHATEHDGVSIGIYAGIAEGVPCTGSKDELQSYTRNLILDHGKRGLILGGDCTIASDLDWNRIKWVIEAARSL